jgi:hypothetical protein
VRPLEWRSPGSTPPEQHSLFHARAIITTSTADAPLTNGERALHAQCERQDARPRQTLRVPLGVEMIEFDLNGRRLSLEEATVQELRANALAGAGSSTTLNDLAVILSRALSDRKVTTLRRAESRALQDLLDSKTA